MGTASDRVVIRAFDGSTRDARAIIEIDGATFADCPYSAEQIVDLEADPGQYAWLAVAGDRIVGYVSAFATHSLTAGRWEVDELAVHPQAQGRGIGTTLVAQALAEGARQSGLREARALVAVDNLASQRVFIKNGFQAVDTVHLLAYRVNGRAPRVPRPNAPETRLARAEEGSALARLLGADAPSSPWLSRQMLRTDVQYLVAVDGSTLLGGAELLHVRTLQYEGLWIEALGVIGRSAAESRAAIERRVASALVAGAIERAKRQEGMDLVGYLIVPHEHALYSAARAEGMALVDVYKSFVYEW
jgi:ribosomal protein S18 acetylase RimI-like enzyme